jgi:hypothetical protein
MGCTSSSPAHRAQNSDTVQPTTTTVVAGESASRAVRPMAVNDLFPRVVALYDYVARSDRELTFRAGDLLICKCRNVCVWLYACHAFNCCN